MLKGRGDDDQVDSASGVKKERSLVEEYLGRIGATIAQKSASCKRADKAIKA